MANKFINQTMRMVAILTISIVILSLIHLSPGITTVNLILDKGTGYLIIIFFPLIYLAFRRRGWLKSLYVVGILSLFYGLLLKWFWTTGYTQDIQLWGFLPTNEAGNLYQEVLSFLSGNPLNNAITSHPISVLFFSSILRLTNLNLMVTLWVMVFLNVFGSLIASNEVRKTHGSLAASIYLTAGLLFYRYLIGTLMTEQLGFLLGNLAFACLWNSIQNKNVKIALLGLSLVSLGINILPGAIFLLVTLVIWAGFYFRENKFSFRWTGIALIVALSGFAINAIITNIFIPDKGMILSDYGLNLYGIAVGNLGSNQFAIDHPGVSMNQAIPVAIQQIVNDPQLFLKGIASGYQNFINPSGCWAFCFLRLSSMLKNIPILGLLLAGIIYVLRNWKKPIPMFLIFSLVGIALSVPLIPTVSLGYRASTIIDPLLVSLLFVSTPWLNALWEKVRQLTLETQSPEEAKEEDRFPVFQFTYPILAVNAVLLLLIPFISTTGKLTSAANPQNCAANEVQFAFLTNRDSWINIIQPDSLPSGISVPYATQATLSDLVSSSPYHAQRGFTESLQYAKPGASIGYAPLDSGVPSQGSTSGLAVAVVSTADLPHSMGQVKFCATEVTQSSNHSDNIRTYIASNITSTCFECGVLTNHPWVENFSSYSLILFLSFISVEGLYSQFTFRPVIRRTLADFKKYWEYISFAARAELKTEVAGSFLGWIWWILDPLFFMFVYTFVVSYVFRSGGKDFPIFVFIGLTAWNFMYSTVYSSVQIIVSFRSIISKVYLPKYVLILVRMYKNLIKMGISFILVFVLMYFFKVEYSWKIIYLLPVIIVHIITTFSMSIIVAHIGVFVADSANIMNVVLRFLFYVSGVIYSVGDRIPDPYRTLMFHVDPIAVIIQAYRDVIMNHQFPSVYYLIYWLIIGTISCLYFIKVMYRYENTYVKVVQHG